MKLNLIAIAGVAMLISSVVISCNDASQSNAKGSEVKSNSKLITSPRYEIRTPQGSAGGYNSATLVIFADSITINSDGTLTYMGPILSGTIKSNRYAIQKIN